MSRPTTAPLMFVPLPGAGSVQALFQNLEETAKAAVAEKESPTEETYHQGLFRQLLHQVIDIIAGPVGQQRSVGIAWLSHGENRILFRQIVPAAECSAFFKAHLTNEFITGMLEDAGILSLVPEAERSEFVRSVLGNWIPTGEAWVDGALSAQLSRDALVASILYWLHHPKDFHDGDAFAARFLRTGSGKALYTPGGYWTMPFGKTLWSLFHEDELREALTICAERAPNVFFEAPAEGDVPVSLKVQLTLIDSEWFSELMSLAIRNLQFREGLSAQAFDSLNKRDKLAMIRRPEICPLPLLVKFALDYINSDGYQQFQVYAGQITRHCTDYAADLVESFGYIRKTKQAQQNAPYVDTRIRRIEAALRRNAVMHRVDLSGLDI